VQCEQCTIQDGGVRVLSSAGWITRARLPLLGYCAKLASTFPLATASRTAPLPPPNSSHSCSGGAPDPSQQTAPAARRSSAPTASISGPISHRLLHSPLLRRSSAPTASISRPPLACRPGSSAPCRALSDACCSVRSSLSVSRVWPRRARSDVPAPQRRGEVRSGTLLHTHEVVGARARLATSRRQTTGAGTAFRVQGPVRVGERCACSTKSLPTREARSGSKPSGTPSASRTACRTGGRPLFTS